MIALSDRGRIVWVGSVQCAACDQRVEGIPNTMGRAVLKGQGWRMRSHRWYCRQHAGDE